MSHHINTTLALAVILASVVLPPVLAKETPVPAYDRENMLQDFNPGFEAPVANSKIPGWTISYGNAQVVADPKTGARSLKIGPSAQLYSDKYIKIEPGYIYHISAWGKYKNVKFVNNAKYGVGIGLEQVNGDRKINGNWYDMQTYIKYTDGTMDWVLAQREWLPKDTAVYLRPFILMDAEPGSEAWIDDIRVWMEKAPEIKVERLINIIENASFEVRMDKTPNGYAIKAPSGLRDVYSKNSYCVEDVKHSGQASMKISGECTMDSNAGYVASKTAIASIAVKTVGVSGTGSGAFARLMFYDKNHKLLKKQDAVSVQGTNDWKVYEHTLNDISQDVCYIQWEFGMDKGSTGAAYFDDLQINIPSVLQGMPRREKDTANVNVSVDCSSKKGMYTSPLNAYDNHNADRVYSPTIGTAGKFVDGKGHWYLSRKSLGFKYARIHHIYGSNTLTGVRQVDGKWKTFFEGDPRIDPKTGKQFPPAYRVDANGKEHYDFSSVKYLLDNGVLPGGCKPIIGLETVPAEMAKYGNVHNIPNDFKKWEEMNYQFVKFLVETYGAKEVSTWIFETGNEPSTGWEFHGDPDNMDNAMNDFFKLQDYIVAGVTRALPNAFIAGPSGGPDNWMEPMLEHCASGVNYATGKIGTKLDALELHGYMGGYENDISWRPSEDQVLRWQGYIKRFQDKTGKKLRLFNTEYAPVHFDGQPDINNIPHYRNNHIEAIATMHMGNFEGKLGVDTMAFFLMAPFSTVFYDGVPADKTPEFNGGNTPVTYHGIFTPISRAHQMLSWLNGGREVSVVADKDPIYAISTIKGKQIRVLCYSFDVNPQVTYTTSVNLTVNPAGLGHKFKATKYEFSGTKGNSWYLAQQMKLTQADCERDVTIVDRINRASEIKPENAGVYKVEGGKLNLNFSMPAYSAVLYVFDPVN